MRFATTTLIMLAIVLAFGTSPARAEEATPRLVRTNLDERREMVFHGHVLTDFGALDDSGDKPRILYAPSEEDDPEYRFQIANLVNGIVDYYDVRFGVPDHSLLETYDAVHVWSNFPFLDPGAFGDVLADFVTPPLGPTPREPKCVILGYGCLLSNGLAGAIMTPAYCPVYSPSGQSTGSSPYRGDGETCIWSNVNPAFAVFDREDIALNVPNGARDGNFMDFRIAAAYNVRNGVAFDPPVIYLNGAQATTGQDIPCWVVSALTCHGMEIDECPEDLNNDQTVDFADVIILLGAWGESFGPGDFNNDGVINFADVLAMLGSWGTCGVP